MYLLISVLVTLRYEAFAANEGAKLFLGYHPHQRWAKNQLFGYLLCPSHHTDPDVWGQSRSPKHWRFDHH
jgi:hypothetical protein